MNTPLRCVVIDDDPDWIDLVKRCLARSKLPLNVTTFCSGASALAYLRHGSPAAIVTDFRMPGMDGLELIRTLRMHGCRAPVVMISNDRHPEAEARRTGAEAFVLKGRLASELCDAVERSIAGEKADERASAMAAGG